MTYPAYLICFFISTANISSFCAKVKALDSVTSPSKDVTQVFSHFRTSHIKLYSSSSQGAKMFELEGIFPILYEFFTLSLHFRNSRKSQNHHVTRRYSTGFIHCYVLDHFNLSSHQIDYRTINAERVGEKPDHIFLYEDSLQVNFLYRAKLILYCLSVRLSMGLVIGVIKLRSLYMACLTCKQNINSVIFKLTLKDTSNINALWHLWKKINWNLQNAYVDPEWLPRQQQLSCNIDCEGFARPGKRSRSGLMRMPTFDICVHKLLGKWLNYTYISKTGAYTYFYTSGKNFVNKMNLKRQENNKVHRFEWIPHAVEYKSFYFITVLKRPGFNAMSLIYPFDFIIWVFIFVSGFVVMGVLYISVGRQQILQIVTDVFRSALEQTVSGRFRQCKNSNSGLTSCLFLIWFVAIFVVSQAYKGKIFCFLARNGEPTFPQSLKELVKVKFPKFTISPTKIGPKMDSVFKNVVLNNMPNWYASEYSVLNKTVLWYSNNLLYFVDEVCAKSFYASGITTNKTPVSVNLSESDIIFVDYQKDVSSVGLLISSFLPENTVSPEVMVPGYTLMTPWEVSRNSFYPVFVSALASYYESGLYQKLDKHILNLFHCFNFDVMRKFTKKYNNSLIDQRGCGENGAKYYNQVKPINYSVIHPLVVVYGLLIALCSCLFVIEQKQRLMRRARLKRRKWKVAVIKIKFTLKRRQRAMAARVRKRNLLSIYKFKLKQYFGIF